MSKEIIPYDPFSDQQGIISLLIEKFNKQTLYPLTSLEKLKIKGAGIYGLYYCGTNLPIPYQHSVDTPIYIGKATPSGGRKNAIDTDVVNTNALHNRLKDHLYSLQCAQNLDPAHFWIRTLVVAPLWIYHGESFLIGHHNPIWNVVIDGFGNADPGINRTQQPRSKWDILHPGRPYSNANCEIIKYDPQKLLEDIQKHYQKIKWR